jgi:formylglycine-generating enzyme required for sulfatase activity
MVVVGTNVTPGRDFDTLRIRVQDDASREIAYHYAWDGVAKRASVLDGGYLPFTLNVQNAIDTIAERRVSVTAWKDGAPVFARDAGFVLPASGVKSLHVDVDGLCFPVFANQEAKAKATEDGAWATSCAEASTCVGGVCAPEHVDTSALTEYTPERVYGGAPGPGPAGACVDALGCFAPPPALFVDESALAQRVLPRVASGRCSFEALGLISNAQTVVAIEAPPDFGTCGANGCVLLLDEVSDISRESGWRRGDGRIFLPESVCRVPVENGPLFGPFVRAQQRVDARCRTKTPEVPACAEWSSIGTRSAANRDEELAAAGAVEGASVLCARRAPDGLMCGLAGVICGELYAQDPSCDSRVRRLSCRGDGATTACPSQDTSSMKRIPGGTFTMGGLGVEDGAYIDEAPRHPVTVSTFYLDTTEVTAGAYQSWCLLGGSGKPDCQAVTPPFVSLDPRCALSRRLFDHPMNCISWAGANAYCAAQGKRLPTEEEWEFAARSASSSRFPWGNGEPSSDTRLCWSGIAARDGTCAVGSHPQGASAQGVQDLAGNVAEWTSSPYSTHYAWYRTSAEFVHRGGSWSTAQAGRVRAAARGKADPKQRDFDVGFRCARSE